MKKQLLLAAFACLSLLAMAQESYSRFTDGLPFGMPAISAPSIPGYTVSLTDFGAVGDGETLCTASFANAIDALSKRGGGHLIVPRGIWHTGPIVLKSNIDLHLEMVR